MSDTKIITQHLLVLGVGGFLMFLLIADSYMFQVLF